MSPNAGTSIVPDDQVSLAHTRVHGRLRRRRNRLRGAGVAAMACVALLGVAVATRDRGQEAEAPGGIYAMTPEGPTAGASVPEQDGICGEALASAEAFGLELTIPGTVEWPALQAHPGAPQQVVVVARNAGSRSLTVSFPAGVVGLSDAELVDAEPAEPVLRSTTVTLEPSEVVEMPAGLPHRSCAGDALDGGGTYTIAPVVAVEVGRSPVTVLGSALTVQHG